MTLTFCYDKFDDRGNPSSSIYNTDIENNISPVNMGWAGYDIPPDIKDSDFKNIRDKFTMSYKNHSFSLKSMILDIDIKSPDEADTKYYYVVDVFAYDFWYNENAKYPTFNEKVINDIKNKKCKILVLFVNECLLYRDKQFIDSIFSAWITKYDLPKQSIVVCSGAYDFDIGNKEYVSHVFFACWECSMKNFYNKNTYRMMKSAIFTNMIRNKLFLCYNRRPHIHRQEFVYSLYKNDLLQYGLVSLNSPQKKSMKIKHIPKYLSDMLPMTFDNTDLQQNQAMTLLPKDYLNTYLSVITETLADNDVFPSEKIFKPILMLHPFIVVSSKHYLKMMKELGYQTFSPWFDESYDEVDNLAIRIRIITDEIQRLSELKDQQKCNMLIDMFPVLEHNHKTFITRVNSKELQNKLEIDLWK